MKRYLKGGQGVRITNLFADIPPLQSSSLEKTGYRTQKPRILLERLIEASTDPAMWVLDPFCGCATTCVAAERLGRQWVGIDCEALAYQLVRSRLQKETGFGGDNGLFPIHHLTEPLHYRRVQVTPYQQLRRRLYGEQEGLCNGCRNHFRVQNLEVDHIMPKNQGGSEDDSNKQLLCGWCNRKKGVKSQTEFIALLQAEGWRS